MRGIKSNGMLVAASNAEHTVVELVTPPADAQPGERIWFGGEEESSQAAPAGANQVRLLRKKKFQNADVYFSTCHRPAGARESDLV